MAVEMEAAALFTVAAYRSVEISAAFVPSDSLAEMTWQPKFGTSGVRQAMLELFESLSQPVSEVGPPINGVVCVVITASRSERPVPTNS